MCSCFRSGVGICRSCVFGPFPRCSRSEGAGRRRPGKARRYVETEMYRLRKPWNLTMKRNAPVCLGKFGLVLLFCLSVLTTVVEARHVPEKPYRGGNFMLEAGAFTKCGSRIDLSGGEH